MIKSNINFDINNTQDFWLHRYSSVKHIDSLFQNKCLNIRFTTALEFDDAYEGWNINQKDLKDAIDDAIKYHNRCTNLGGKVESIYWVLKTYIDDYTDKKINDAIEIIEILKNYNDLRSSTFLSCWFKTDMLEEENRAMWNRYGDNENGIRTSVRWSDLKKQLEQIDENFEVGFVDYGNKKELTNLFFIKDISYSLENEFRIVINKQDTSSQEIHIPLRDLESVYCTVIRGKSFNETDNKLKKLGFNSNSNTGFVLKESNLAVGKSQVDWLPFLNLLKDEIKARKV